MTLTLALQKINHFKMGFSINDIKNSAVGHLNQHLFNDQKSGVKKDLLKKSEAKIPKYSKYKSHIDQQLVLFCEGKPLTLYREFPFYPGRKFKFDWAILELKVAFEYEGIFGGGKSGHTTHAGYNKDTFKYNAAAEMGWKVYRYTATTYKNIEEELKSLK